MFKCEKCGKEFTRKDNLKRHLKNGVCDRVTHNEDFDEQQAVHQLSEMGYTVSKPQILTDIHKNLNLKTYDGDKYIFAVVSDTHFGSRWQQLTHLHTFYEKCASMGISTVLHAGDLVAGQKIYRGQEFELFMHGADAQTEYAIKYYPRIKGIKTLMISGNHDLSHYKYAGVDVCQAVAKERDDIEYLGKDGAYLNMHGISIYLAHGTGGNAYARSYKLQKVIEQLAPEQKPNILIMGHYHTQVFMPMYRNVMAIQMPCFEAQTPYLKRKGLYPEVGGIIIEFVIDKTHEYIGMANFKVEFVPFYIAKTDDY